jgi:uncharacterized protein (DUF58 family)
MELSIEVCAVIAFSAIKNGDKVGMVLFSDKIEKVIPPKKGRTHVLRLIRELYVTRPEGRKTDIGGALSYLNRLLNRRTIVVLASDFQDDQFQKQHKITNRKHDLVNLVVNDQFEDELPDAGLITLKDAETGMQKLVDTSSKKVRLAYKTRRLEQEHELQEYFRKNKMDSVSLKTNQSYVKPLINFFQRRIHRR